MNSIEKMCDKLYSALGVNGNTIFIKFFCRVRTAYFAIGFKLKVLYQTCKYLIGHQDGRMLSHMSCH